MFKGFAKTEWFDLSWNHITVIHEEAFESVYSIVFLCEPQRQLLQATKSGLYVHIVYCGNELRIQLAQLSAEHLCHAAQGAKYEPAGQLFYLFVSGAVGALRLRMRTPLDDSSVIWEVWGLGSLEIGRADRRVPKTA